MASDKKNRPLQSPKFIQPARGGLLCNPFWAAGSLFLLAWMLWGLAAPATNARAQEGTPAPGAGPMPDRLAAPPTVYPPSQADLGAQVFYQVCMACHGDRGQGLTDEWRQVLDPPDQNCWQSGCHASNHPPGGFVFPRYVPSVVSPGMVARFETARDLHQFLKEKMPWQAPGSRSEDEYWQLTAFLLRENGIDPGPANLDESRAAAIAMRAWLQQPPVSGETVSPWIWWGSAAVGIAFLFLLVKLLRGTA